jgi:peptidylprolyl isomerase
MSAGGGSDGEIVVILEGGRVTIALRPDLAPLHTARIRQLAVDRFYDGAPFGRVVEGFMAQVTPDTPSAYPDLPAELTDVRHVRGACLMARGLDPDSANCQFFILTNDAAFTGCQYTLWGHVTGGLEHVDALPPGEPPAEPARIVSLRVSG